MSAAAAQTAKRHVLVAGAAGGVGTTTVAALLAAAHVADGGSVALVDHSGGSLAARLPTTGTGTGVVGLTVHDRGTRPAAAGSVPGLDAAVLVLVASSTPAAAALLPQVLEQVSDHDATVHLVLVQAHGRYRHRAADLGVLPVSRTLLPRDDGLAADGPISWSLLSRGTRRAVDDLVQALRPR